MKNLLSIVIVLITIFSNIFAENITINGHVSHERGGQSLGYVNIFQKDTKNGTISNDKGFFKVTVKAVPAVLVFSHIGFERKEILVDSREEFIEVSLKRDVLTTKAVEVNATRAVEGKTPVAFSTLTIDEIETRYTVEDVPMVLAMEPGIYSYSESGNGTGYSYVSIRGFDQSRIAVMLDNVPLNDNESHQVYWVDHGDILADARDVQIQRGIGNSLYGAAAFGGSINVQTQIAKPEAEMEIKAGYGSYNTQKYSARFNSGQKFGRNLSVHARVSSISSEGYRDHHGSDQKAISTGIEHRTDKVTHQFRALIGYENTNLTWDGVSGEMIDDRKARTGRMDWSDPYTDDFLQQIYSLNTFYKINPYFSLRNVAYLVKGSGYYEVEKYGVNYLEYNLDVNHQYSDEEEEGLETDLLRRKWIINHYAGITPTLTFREDRFRIDLGSELRFYTGDHAGKVKGFSKSDLLTTLGDDWYLYYDYIGSKISSTSFVHAAFFLTEKINLMADLQYQVHQWNLDQKKIGHAMGHELSADWNFLNPRFGAMVHLTDATSVFLNYGLSHKEPADNQIIEADDAFSEPVMAAAEKVDDFESGLQIMNDRLFFKANLYRLQFDNEQLKNIDVQQEGEYEYYSADGTLHQGIELSLNYAPGKKMNGFVNATFAQNIFTSGNLKDNRLPNSPSILANLGINYKLHQNLSLFVNSRYVGRQFLDNENTGKIDPYFITDLGGKFNWKDLTFSAKINNLFDTLYATFGYVYWGEYYWPGATRNLFVSIAYSL
ncbi:MAG: TonB-dependent receptor [Candidatus Marinimicrobia bacterium]|nr:TonB-dependent receptor [Candidatus Neomarinimicrobiota bacterium]